MRQAAIKDSAEYYDDGKDDQIWEWVSNSQNGLMGFEFGDIPEDCREFCIQQFHRFQVPLPNELIAVIDAGASAAFHYADVVDPYVLFKGISDVDATVDWSKYTYEIHDADGSPVSREADPQFLETFRFVPGQCEAAFADFVSKPGLQSLPWMIGEMLRDVLEGHGEEVWDTVDSDTETVLRAVCTPPGGSEPDKQRMLAYFELAAWAGFIWLAGPYGREYRRSRHDIIGCVLEYGECVLVDGTITAPIYYTKHNRPPNSCHRCGVQGWCVEHTMVGMTTAFICEACLNQGVRPIGHANCGTKFCKNSLCPHHPLAHMGQAGMFAGGQLAIMAKHGSDLRLHGEIRPMLR